MEESPHRSGEQASLTLRGSGTSEWERGDVRPRRDCTYMAMTWTESWRQPCFPAVHKHGHPEPTVPAQRESRRGKLRRNIHGFWKEGGSRE